MFLPFLFVYWGGHGIILEPKINQVLKMFLHYLKMAFRSLGKYRMQNVISIVSLAVALFCFSLNMYLTRFVAGMDKWLDDSVLYLTDQNGICNVSFDVADEVRQQCPQVEALARFNVHPFSWCEWRETSMMYSDYFIHTDTTVLDILGLKVVAGNWRSVTNTISLHSVALTESFAKREFGSADEALDKELWIGDMGFFRVGVVVEDMPYANSLSNFEFIAGWLFSKDGSYMTKGEFGPAFVKLKKGIDPDDFINSLSEPFISESHGKKTELTLYKFYDNVRNTGILASKESSLRTDLDAFRFTLALLLVSLPGIIILIVALFNYFHLLVNSILSGQREYALRRVHGARTVDMWLMVSTQIILTTILTGILSLFIARYVTPLIQVRSATRGVGEVNFYMNVNVILNHTVQYIIMLVAVGLLIAWLAVIRVRGAETGNMIKRHYGGRNLMLGVQLTFAQLVITILVALLLNMKSTLKGFYTWLSKEDKTCIITDRNYYTTRTIDKMKIEMSYLESLPYITHVTSMLKEYLYCSNYLMIPYAESTLDDVKGCTRMLLTPEIMDMLEVRIKEGSMPVKRNEVLVDDTFIEIMGLGIGDTFRIRDLKENYGEDIAQFSIYQDWIPLIITGSIGNLRDEVEFFRDNTKIPAIYSNWEPTEGYIVVRCLPGYQDETKKAIAKYHHPDAEDTEEMITYSASSLYDYLYQYNNVWNSIGFIAWIVAVFAFIITLLGVYSAISIDTTRRRKEMAMRKINGARTRQVAMLFTKLYLKLFIISSVVSIPLSASLIKTIILNGSYDKGLGFAVLFYLFVLAVMVVFVGLTIGFKIHRIARENPADVIKSD